MRWVLLHELLGLRERDLMGAERAERGGFGRVVRVALGKFQHEDGAVLRALLPPRLGFLAFCC